MESTVSFGYWLRRQRKARDLTQQALADQIGCSVAAIKKIETDERRPSRQIAERMADILDVPENQHDIFLEVARGVRSADQLPMASEPAVPALPAGIVTFLFTDIAGSTLLAQKHPDAWKNALARHHAILRTVIEFNHGYVDRISGDSFSAAFHNALDALHAALAGQRRLRDEPWDPTVAIRVRMGLHTGMAEIPTEKAGKPYSGYATIATTQRVMSAAHGGQVLLSGVTCALLEGLLPPDVTLLDMGEHRLNDLWLTSVLFPNPAGVETRVRGRSRLSSNRCSPAIPSAHRRWRLSADTIRLL